MRFLHHTVERQRKWDTIGTGFFFWGLYAYMKGKGHHGAWALLGVLGLIGLVVLIFFGDRNPHHQSQSQGGKRTY